MAFCALHSSQDYLGLSWRRAKWSRNEAYMGRGKKGKQFLVDKPEGKKPIGRPRRRWRWCETGGV